GVLLKLDEDGQFQDSVDTDTTVGNYRNVSDLAISDTGYVYFGNYASELCAVSPGFTVAWRGPAGYDHMQQAASLGADNKLYMINESQMGYLLNAITGATIDSYSMATWYQKGGIALGDDGRVYWAANKGGESEDRVICFDTTTGLQWYTYVGDSDGADLTSVVMAPNGALYVSDSDGGESYLYKILTDATAPLDSDWPMRLQNPGQTACADSGRYRSGNAQSAIQLLLLSNEDEYAGTCDLGTGSGCDALGLEDGDMFIVRFNKDVDEYYLESYITDPSELVASATVDKPSGGTVPMTYELYRADEWFTNPNIYLGTDPTYAATLPQTFTGTVTMKDGKRYKIQKTISTWQWAE
ncbi:MAG: hypothetical protein AB7D57_13565, partial [Desulfovibrionaceae bacterium]